MCAIVATRDLPEVAGRLARAFLTLAGAGPDAPRRMRALVQRDGAAAVFAAAGLAAETVGVPPRAGSPRNSVGILSLGDRVGLGAAPPFGRMRAEAFAELARAARAAGASGLRLTPWRTIVAVGLEASRAPGLAKQLAALGFIVAPDDPRLGVVTCPGAPACAHAESDTQADARRFAELLPPRAQSSCTSAAAPRAAPAPPRAADAGGEAGQLRSRRRRPRGRSAGASRPLLRASRGAGEISGRRPRRVTPFDYVKDGAEIYRRSFATIRREAELSRFSPLEERIAVQIIHACGQVETAADIVFTPGAAETASAALRRGAAIFCDARMVAEGVTRARLPANNEVVCTLSDPSVPALAARIGNTRSAAALDLWGDRVGGALVAIGNAPTALFRLLEMIEAGAPRPAAIVGMPVGFVGAAESKEALLASGLPAIVVRGRKGGSAMAAAAVNALASERE